MSVKLVLYTSFVTSKYNLQNSYLSTMNIGLGFLIRFIVTFIEIVVTVCYYGYVQL